MAVIIDFITCKRAGQLPPAPHAPGRIAAAFLWAKLIFARAALFCPPAEAIYESAILSLVFSTG